MVNQFKQGIIYKSWVDASYKAIKEKLDLLGDDVTDTQLKKIYEHAYKELYSICAMVYGGNAFVDTSLTDIARPIIQNNLGKYKKIIENSNTKRVENAMKPDKSGAYTLEQIKAHIIENGYTSVDANKFFDYYNKKGWDKVYNLKSTLKFWQERNEKYYGSSNQKKSVFHDFEKGNYDYDKIEKELFNGGDNDGH